MEKKHVGTFLMIVVSVFHIGAVRTSAAQSEDTGGGVSALSAEMIAQQLGQVVDGKTNLKETRGIVRAAGKSGKQEFAPRLRSIALTYSLPDHPMGGHELIAFDAIHSLWLLGERKEYFLESAKNYKGNPMLAYYSILILGYNPTSEVTNSLPSKEETLSMNLINGALATYRYVDYWSKTYQDTAEYEKKFGILANRIGSGWSAFGVDGSDPEKDLSPAVVWGQAELYKLSKEQPTAVAESIFSWQPAWITNAANLESLQNYLLRYVVQETRSQFEILRKSEATKSQK